MEALDIIDPNTPGLVMSSLPPIDPVQWYIEILKHGSAENFGPYSERCRFLLDAENKLDNFS